MPNFFSFDLFCLNTCFPVTSIIRLLSSNTIFRGVHVNFFSLITTFHVNFFQSDFFCLNTTSHVMKFSSLHSGMNCWYCNTITLLHTNCFGRSFAEFSIKSWCTVSLIESLSGKLIAKYQWFVHMFQIIYSLNQFLLRELRSLHILVKSLSVASIMNQFNIFNRKSLSKDLL